MQQDKKNYCTLFPDEWRHIIEFDIAGVCCVHDYYYETPGLGVTRKEADDWMYDKLMELYPKYKPVWKGIYLFIRKVGWVFWYWHRRPSWLSK